MELFLQQKETICGTDIQWQKTRLLLYKFVTPMIQTKPENTTNFIISIGF